MEKESVQESASGKCSVRVNGISIHSAYEPEKEAENFLERSEIGKNPGLVIILGAGLNYLGAALRRKNPRLRILSLQYSDFYRGKEKDTPDSSLYVGSSEDVRKFLERELDESDMGDLSVIAWPPSTRAYPAAAKTVAEELAARFRILKGSIATTQAFGGRWIRNSLRNILTVREISVPEPIHKPIFVAASGPSLNESLPLLRRERDSFFLVALSSSLEALAAGGIRADLAVATDSGEWAGFHLASLARGIRPEPFPVPAFPLTSCPRFFVPSSSAPLLLYGYSPIERDILRAFSLPFLPCPASGTVTDSALRAALSLSGSPIVVFGLDLCTGSSRSHAWPSAFESMMRAESSRSQPYDSALWERIVVENSIRKSWGRTSIQLETYSSGLSRLGQDNPGRIRRFHPSRVDLPGFDPITEREIHLHLAGARGRPEGFHKYPLPGLPERRGIVQELLRRWKDSALESIAPAQDEGQVRGRPRPSSADARAVGDSLLSYLCYPALIRLRKARRRGAATEAAAEAIELGERVESFFSDIEKRYFY